jgi:hypothetical protein
MRRLQAMMAAGVVSTNSEVVFEVKSSRYTATISDDGCLLHAKPNNGTSSTPSPVEIYTSPSEWALAMAKRHNIKRSARSRSRGKITVNGWVDCSIDGRSLQDLRTTMMRDSKVAVTLREAAGSPSPPNKPLSSGGEGDDGDADSIPAQEYDATHPAETNSGEITETSEPRVDEVSLGKRHAPGSTVDSKGMEGALQKLNASSDGDGVESRTKSSKPEESALDTSGDEEKQPITQDKSDNVLNYGHGTPEGMKKQEPAEKDIGQNQFDETAVAGEPAISGRGPNDDVISSERNCNRSPVNKQLGDSELVPREICSDGSDHVHAEEAGQGSYRDPSRKSDIDTDDEEVVDNKMSKDIEEGLSNKRFREISPVPEEPSNEPPSKRQKSDATTKISEPLTSGQGDEGTPNVNVAGNQSSCSEDGGVDSDDESECTSGRRVFVGNSGLSQDINQSNSEEHPDKIKNNRLSHEIPVESQNSASVDLAVEKAGADGIADAAHSEAENAPIVLESPDEEVKRQENPSMDDEKGIPGQVSPETRTGDEDENVSLQHDSATRSHGSRVSRRTRPETSSRRIPEISELQIMRRGGYDAIANDPAAAEAAAVAAAAEKEEAVNRARRTTRLAAGKIKQVDYKVSAAMANTRGASLSGNEMDDSDDIDDLSVANGPRRRKTRYRVLLRSPRISARDRSSRRRPSHGDKHQNSGSDDGERTVGGDGSDPGNSGSIGSRDSVDNPSRAIARGTNRAQLFTRKSAAGTGSGSGDVSNENAGTNGLDDSETNDKTGVSKEDASGSGRDSLNAKHGNGSEEDPSGTKGSSMEKETRAFPCNDEVGSDDVQRDEKSHLNSSVDKSEDSDDDDDRSLSAELEDADDADDDDPRDEQGLGVPELSAIAQAVKYTGSLDPSTVVIGAVKADGMWSSYGCTQDDVAKYLEVATGCIREYCPRSLSASSSDSGIRINDMLSFIAAEVWRLSSGVHRPAGAVAKVLRKKGRLRNALDKNRKKLKRDVDENRAKLECEMDIRRRLNLETAYGHVCVGDCARALEREVRKRRTTEAEIKLFEEREADARERTELMKSLTLRLHGDRFDEMTEEDSVAFSTAPEKQVVPARPTKGNGGGKATESRSRRKGVRGTADTDGDTVMNGCTVESGTSADMEDVGDALTDDQRAGSSVADGFTTENALEIRRLETLIATYELDAEKWQRVCENERTRVNSLLESKTKYEHELYMQRHSWPSGFASNGLPPSGGSGNRGRDGALGSKRVDVNGRGATGAVRGGHVAPGRSGKFAKAHASAPGAGAAMATAENNAREEVAVSAAGAVAANKAEAETIRQASSRRKGLPQRSPHS